VSSEDEVTETQTYIMEEVEEAQTVVTRAQAQKQKEEKKSKPLTVSDSVDVGVEKTVNFFTGTRQYFEEVV